MRRARFVPWENGSDFRWPEFCSFRLFGGRWGLDPWLRSDVLLPRYLLALYAAVEGGLAFFKVEIQDGWLWRTPVRLILEYLLRLDR